MLSRKSKIAGLDAILEEIRLALREKPFKRLCEKCIQLDPFLFVEKVIRLEKNPREIIDFDFKSNECLFNSDSLHPDLRGHDTFSNYFKKLKTLEQIV